MKILDVELGILHMISRSTINDYMMVKVFEQSLEHLTPWKLIVDKGDTDDVG